jgi:hypothetical protein
MKLETKKQISSFLTYVMLITVVFILIWFIGFVVSSVFDLSVLGSKSTDLVFGAFGLALVLIFCAAILSVTINISVIADSVSTKEAITVIDKKSSGLLKNVLLISSIVLVLFIGILFAGDYFSKNKLKNTFLQESASLINDNSSSLNDLIDLLESNGDTEKCRKLFGYLESQFSDFNSVRILIPSSVNGKNVFLMASEYDLGKTQNNKKFTFPIAKKEGMEKKYLEDVLNGSRNTPSIYYESGEYTIYRPYVYKNKTYLIQLNKYNRSGAYSS